MDEVALEGHLQLLGFDQDSRREILVMAAAPAKDVERGALNNVVVRQHSEKNQGIVSVASHTVERLCALELELDSDVLAYFPQVRCVGIERRDGSHVSSGTVDFMAVRRDAIHLIECKGATSVDKLIADRPDEWVMRDGRLTRPPYDEWARNRNLTFRVWVGPSRVGPYLANLQLIYAVLTSFGTAPMSRAEERALSLIRKRPQTLRELVEGDARFTTEIAARLIGNGQAFGTTHHVPMDDLASFTLYSSPEQAQHAEELILRSIHEGTSHPTDALSSASAMDIQKATERLAVVDQFLRGTAKPPRYWAELARDVASARARGESALAVCLTNYSSSGNRLSRQSHDQIAAVRNVVRTHWNTGLAKNLTALHAQLRLDCEPAGLRAPSYKSLRKAVMAQPQAQRQLAVGGVRHYQANKAASDPRYRSVDAIARHLVLEIDATKCDNRCFSLLNDILLLDTPLLYAGLDGCTHEAMAHAFVFGPARTDGVSLLLRDYVRRHGRLPHEIRIDRASENKCAWMKGFCRNFRISLLILPTGGSRYKGDLENMLGRVNSQVSHQLAGSTLPDQAGRAVDGRFKSYYTALHQFETIQREIEICLYSDFLRTPDSQGVTPEEMRVTSAANFPSVGFLQKLDDDFMFQSSIPVRARSFDPKKGLRTEGQAFTSEELLAAMATSDIKEIRRDVWDPSLLRVQLSNGRVRAWSRLTSRVAHASPTHRQFHVLFAAQRRAQSCEIKERVRLERYQRTAAANTAAHESAPVHSTAFESVPSDTRQPNSQVSEGSATFLDIPFDDVDDLEVSR